MAIDFFMSLSRKRVKVLRVNLQGENPSPLIFNLKRNEKFWISIVTLILPYFGIILTVLLVEKCDRWGLRLAALPIIAAFQNHLQILLHEGAHFQRKRFIKLF